MKKIRKLAVSLLAVCMLTGITSLSASALSEYRYDLWLPAENFGSMRSTDLGRRTSGTPYLAPQYNTLKTVYFLSPTRNSSNNATAFTYVTEARRIDLPWLPGHGGASRYCLSAYPDSRVTPRPEYRVVGKWGI